MAKAVLFDMDGLLVDSETLGITVATTICEQLGINLTNKEKQSFIGVTDEKFYRDLFRHKKVNHDVSSVLKKHFDIYEEFLRTRLKPFPGAKTLPRKLKSQGMKLAIVSGSTKKQIGIVLESLDLKEVFEVIISCDDTKSSKPDPEGYLKAAEKLRIKTKDCVVLEDAKTGIQAGKAAGMKVVGVKNAGGQDLTEADEVVESLEGLCGDI